MKKIILSSFLLLTPFLGTHAERILLETEAFSDHGGWKLDTQFIREMGSPYLLAHGLGTPVKDATTTFEVKEAGSYQLFARTKDWVARWGAKDSLVDFKLLSMVYLQKQPLAPEGPNGTGRAEDKYSLKRKEHLSPPRFNRI